MADLAALRAVALALPEVTEAAHLGEPEFLFRRKAFALQWKGRFILKLDRGHQALLFEIRPETFEPCPVATVHWSYVRIEHLDDEELHRLVVEAWSTIAPKRLAAQVVVQPFT